MRPGRGCRWCAGCSTTTPTTSGPFSSKKTAEKCLAALHDTFPVRQCSGRMPRIPSGSACALAEMGRCLSPCDGSTDATTYAAVVRQLRDTLLRSPEEVVEAINHRMTALADRERFEEAGVHRDRLATFVRAAARTQRLSALTRCQEIVAARREDSGRWSVHVVRHGRLAAAGVIPSGADAHQYVRELTASAETVGSAPGPVPAATAEESERILRWLESSGVRLVDVEGEWICPLGGAARHLAVYDAANESRLSLVPFDEKRLPSPVHRPRADESVEPDAEGRLEVVLRVGPERDVRLGLGHALHLVELVGDDRRDVVVLAHPHQGDQVDLPGHRVDLADTLEGGDRLRDLGDARDVGLHEDDGGDHGPP